MIGALRAIRHGRQLRHLPVVWPGPNEVRVEVETLNGVIRDITRANTPISLRPLIIGIHERPGVEGDALRLLRFIDVASAFVIGTIDLRRSGNAESGDLLLGLYEPTGARNQSLSALRRAWRYALARRDATLAARSGDRVGMTGSDLIALDVYYVAARPVYLIGVAFNGERNLFPMDLVSTIDEHEVLALRATSPAIELIRGSKFITMSAAPASELTTIYSLGQHHKSNPDDLASVPLQLRYLDGEGCPALDSGGLVKHVRIDHMDQHGSHVVMIGRALKVEGASVPQVAHVSGLYADWRRAAGRPFAGLTP